jgi:DNA-binding NarL/FixJ family response regulator
MNIYKYAVICVDDDPYILQSIGFQVEKLIDHKTTIVEYYTNSSEVMGKIDVLLNENIEIILAIVDFQMPLMNGAELIRCIKDQHPTIKCLMLSGQASAIHVDDLVNDNLIESFISKPWNENELFNAIEPIIKNKYSHQ